LLSDSFLTSKLDAQNSVPISLVMQVNTVGPYLINKIMSKRLEQFAKLRALTEDEEFVKQALADSKIVCIVDENIRIINRSGRSTLILREIPSNTPESEVREIFDYPGCKPVQSIRSDIGDTWYSKLNSSQLT